MWGYLKTHSGILLIIVGSMVSSMFKIYGDMPISKGGSLDYVQLEDERELTLQWFGADKAYTFPADFNWYRASEPNEVYEIPDSESRVRIKRFFPNVVRQPAKLPEKLKPSFENSAKLLSENFPRRITDLKRQIEHQQRQKQREVEARSSRNFTVSLVGYTNAGKSTLMNALTEAEVFVDPRLFSTLDTRTRLWNLASGVPVLLSDTVGFIRHLPHGLVTSFHSTLEEVSQANLLLHVVDASHPEREEQIKAVEEVLEELQCEEIPMILIFNKIDRLQDPVERTLLENRYPQALILSARTKEGFKDLHPRVADIMTDHFVDIVADIPVTEGRLSAELAEQAMILEKTLIDEHFHMKLKVPRRMAWKLEPYLVPQE